MKYILSIAIASILLFSSWNGKHLYHVSNLENEYKYDFAEVNMIKYGLFNLDIWKEKVFGILEKNVDQFEINASDMSGIKDQIEIYLNQLYKEYFESGKLIDVLMEAQAEDGKSKSLGKMFVGLFKKNIEKEIQKIDFKSQIPTISQSLMNELERKIPEIKAAISESIGDMLADELGEKKEDPRMPYFEKYGTDNIQATNTKLIRKVEDTIEVKEQFLIKTIGGLLISVILLLLGMKTLNFKPSMLWLGLICIISLTLGLTLPMIDLDARLTSVDVSLLGENIHFDEQVMYYQSKSIVDVTRTLLEGKGIDLKIVGILILVFSIVLPFLKMLLSGMYLYLEKMRQKKFVEIVIFYMGKWSMADVFVVAIFMSYIGFYGLLSSQLGDLSGQTSSSAIDTVNYSKLSSGIIFFTAYCVLSIVMSTLIHKKMKRDIA
ncbi:MAG: hypothetical protein HKO66_05550 [Saprospiraceae bacterium]|nr:paraquat-inducible protein A [Bacteroidia bacterium]NNE14225.1 hypothetical protein [Saprospiraceae bacterium]NNL91674.1 hypothetical protein [Saprospiraceae bacterium]